MRRVSEPPRRASGGSGQAGTSGGPGGTGRDGHSGSRRGGFTLIELLVTIAIIAVLIGILLPTMAAVKRRAVKTTCLSNLHQLGLGIQAYCAKNREVFPVARAIPAPFVSTSGDPPLPQALAPFLDASGPGKAVWRCPGDRDYVYARCGASYQYQIFLSGIRVDDLWPVRHIGITPAEVWVLRDFDGGTFEVDGGTVDVPFFHERRNLLFADGHAGNFGKS